MLYLTIQIARSLREASDVIDSKTSHPAGAHSRGRQAACRASLRRYGHIARRGCPSICRAEYFDAQAPLQPVAVRSKDGTAAYGLLKAYGDPNRRSEERNAWIEYLATESDDSILGPEEVDIHE